MSFCLFLLPFYKTCTVALWHNGKTITASVMEVKHRAIEIVLGWGTDRMLSVFLCVIGRVWYVLSVPLNDPMTSVRCYLLCVM